MTKWTPSPTNLLATETPCLGSDTSSPCSSSSFWPRMAPALLKSSTACPRTLVSCAPNEAFGPVIGPATANLICASAVLAKPRPAASTRPVNQYFFILRSLCLGRRQRPRGGNDPTLARYAQMRPFGHDVALSLGAPDVVTGISPPTADKRHPL